MDLDQPAKSTSILTTAHIRPVCLWPGSALRWGLPPHPPSGQNVPRCWV